MSTRAHKNQKKNSFFLCARAWARVRYLEYFSKKKSTFILRIFFKEKSTLRKILTSILIILILIYFIFSFSILNIFNFIICYIHRLVICMAYGHLFVFHDSSYLGVRWTPDQFFWIYLKLNKDPC